MKRIILLLLICTSISWNCSEQNENELIGKWKCIEILGKEEIPESGLKYLENTMVNKWIIEFQKDGTFKTIIIELDSANGKWNYDLEKKLIMVNLKDQSDMNFEVLKFDSKKIDLKSEHGKYRFEKIK